MCILFQNTSSRFSSRLDGAGSRCADIVVSLIHILLLLALAATAYGSEADAAASQPGALAYSGDLRTSLALNLQEVRDGSEHSVLLPAMRIREGLVLTLHPAVQLRMRLAGLLDKRTSKLEFHLDDPATTGNFTLDTAYLHFSPHEKFTLQVGRLQTAFELDSVVEDSLSRHDSSGLAIDWTNGLHLIFGAAAATRLHYIGQANRKSGTTNGVGNRGPVTLAEQNSRVTHYLALEFKPQGPLTQLVVDVTTIPSALHTNGLNTHGSHDLVALTTRAAADFDLGHGLVLHPALELGFTPVTPEKQALSLARSDGGTQGLAVIAGIDLKNLGKGAVGVQYAEVKAGYLLSPDYPPNTRSIELRYSLPVTATMKADLRYRQRRELEKSHGAAATLVDHNLLLRVTLRF